MATSLRGGGCKFLPLYTSTLLLDRVSQIEYLIKPGGLYIQIVLSEKETYEDRPRHLKKIDLKTLSVYLSLIKRNNNS
jgi:hypothetical protein